MIRRVLCRAVAKRALLIALASGFLALVASPWAGAGILFGTPTTTVPSSLFDPLNPPTLSSPLPANEFLLPIEITGASGLQDWSFDLNFTAGVVSPLDAGGLYQSVYQAKFNASDPTPSNITSSGLLFPDPLSPDSLLRNCRLLFRREWRRTAGVRPLSAVDAGSRSGL